MSHLSSPRLCANDQLGFRFRGNDEMGNGSFRPIAVIGPLLHTSTVNCPVHHIVNSVCFWGPRPEKAWKRPLTALLSIPLIALGIAVIWLTDDPGVFGWSLGLMVTAMGFLGVTVAIVGCDACVARTFGDFDFH
jgi:hypothetical protein